VVEPHVRSNQLLPSKNKSQKVGVFLAREKSAFSHHVSPHFYHVLTIKKPRSVHPISQKPPQKRPSTTQIFFPNVTISKMQQSELP
jgi:hypothetical protein